MSEQTLAANWLDCDSKDMLKTTQQNAQAATAYTLTTTGAATAASGMTGLTAGNYQYTPTYQTYQAPYWYWTNTPSRIRLTLSEIDRLRKAAKADDKIKAILAKFTGSIEIVVDFD